MLTRLLACSTALLALALSACFFSRVTLSAAPATLGAVQVRVVDVHTAGQRVTVKAVFTNTSSKPIAVNPEGIDLRVGGKNLEHKAGLLTSKKPITIAPGQKHELDVEFRAD